MKQILFLFLIVNGFLSLAQKNELDSLKSLLKNTVVTEDKILYLTKLSRVTEDSLESKEYISSAILKLESLSGDSKLISTYRIANALYAVNDWEESLLMIDEALSIPNVNDFDALGKVYRLASRIHTKKSHYDKAILSYQKAIEMFTKSGNIPRQIDCLNGVGVIHKNLGNYNQALPLYHAAYKLAKKASLPLKLAATTTNIGVLLKKQEKYDNALEYYFKAEKIYKRENDFGGLANIYNNQGNIYRLQKKYPQSLKKYQLAIENRNKAGNKRMLSYTYNNIALSYQEMGNYQKAIENLNFSMKLKIENEEYESLSSTHLNFSEIYLELNDSKKFKFHINEARRIAIEFHQDKIRRSVLVNMSQFAANNKDFKSAYIYLSSVYDELDTLDLESQKALTSALQAHFESEQDRNEIHELSDAILLLDLQKEELEKKQSVSNWLIIGLGLIILVLVVLSVLFYLKQKALKTKTTELAIANEQILSTTISIEEKELLLKEIHHRVKNNLQIVKSLIRLQADGNHDSSQNALLTDFELRVSSMAMVHESLYKSGDFARVNVQNYFKDLLDNLITVYHLNQTVKTNISINILELGIDTLVPLGLLSTEIISNSMKYGIGDKPGGEITIELKSIGENKYELIVGDNGDGFDFEEASN